MATALRIAAPLALVLAALPVRADQAARFNAEGNRLYQEEQYEDAIRQYRRANIEAPEERIIDFNIGTAQARLGRREESLEAFSRINPQTHPQLYALSRYNQGVMHYREAEQLVAAQQYNEALEALKRTLDANREAIRADRSLDDARFNYEVAKRRYEQLLEMMQDMPPEPQPQPQGDEENDATEGNDDQTPSDEPEDGDQPPQTGEGDDSPTPQPQEETGDEDQPEEPDEQGDEASDGSEDQEDAQSQGSDSDSAPPASPGETTDQMSPEDARALLNALAEEDRSALRRLMRSHTAPPMKNDW